MARNGAGVYTLPAGSTATDGTTIFASQHNTPLSDLEGDANTARPIVAGGTGATTEAAARANLGLAGTAFLATASATQTVAADTWTTITFDGEQFDEGGDAASGVFTVPETGIYMVGGSIVVNVTGSVPAAARVGISVDGGTPANYYRRLTAADAIDNLSTTAHITAPMKLTAAAVLRLQVYFETNGADTGGSNTSSFWAVRLS